MVRITRKRWLPVAVFALIIITAVITGWQPLEAEGKAWYGIAVFTILGVKLMSSVGHLPVKRQYSNLRVAAVVPYYNEDPEMLARCIRSLHEQDYPLSDIIVIDDGSSDTRAHAVVAQWPEVQHVVFPTNKGKREALAAGFRIARNADAYLCVDSDTLLEPNALAEVVKPFADSEVKCVTGLVMASNHRKNLLTRLIDLRYANAFMYERAAYSRVGSVLCACGSLALYRADVIHKYLDDFLGQTFLGQPAVFGDDRRLTNYALLEGKAVFQQSAVAWTAVPEKFGHYVRQQVRWNKSFFRESLWVVRSMSPRKPAFWLSLLELTSWITFTAALIAAFVVHPIQTGQVLFVTYAIYLILLGYARSVRYFEVLRHDVPVWERIGTFLLAPLYGLMHIVVLLPLRVYSLATLNKGSWGTRSQVEVSIEIPGQRNVSSAEVGLDIFDQPVTV